MHSVARCRVDTLCLAPPNTYDRIRHVKCDEEKPSCIQCSRTGRVCDGYEDNVPTTKAMSKLPSYTSLCKSTSAIHKLAPRFSSDINEIHSFDFFRSTIGPIVFQAFKLTVVDQIIMQLSHSDDTVKHAVVALGSLGEQLEKNRTLSPMILDHDNHLQFARLQNVKAIQQLRKNICYGEQRSVELALISCFLFAIFDFLIGDDESSYIHLKAGLNILCGFYAMRDGGSISKDQALFIDQNPLIHDFARIFSEMDLHAVIWLGLASCQSPPFIGIVNGVTTHKLVKTFKSLDDAADSLHYQMMRIHMFCHSLADYGPAAFSLGHSLAECESEAFSNGT